MFKGVGVRFADFIYIFFILYILISSLRPNYFIFTGYLKMGAGMGVQANPHLDPPLADRLIR